MNALSGTSVLIAGASSGMGKATALAAATAGANVALFARRADELAAVAEQVESAGGKAVTASGDATDHADVRRAVEVAAERFGRIDVLVNSVGCNIPDRALTVLTDAGWRELMSTNVDAAFALTQGVLPTLRQQGSGLLIHISSIAAKRPDASGVGYQASKAAVAALAHATMEEERANGVRVSVVYPGFTHTPLVYRRPKPPTEEELAKALQPEDVAHVCLSVMTLPERAHVSEIVLGPAR